MIKSKWTDVSCPICSSQNNRKLEFRSKLAKQRKDCFEFLLHDVQCLDCGHIYEGKIPDSEFLMKYYQQAFTRSSQLVEIKPDFDANNRMKLLDKHLNQGSKIFEIGANDGYFIDILNSNGFRASGFDPLDKGEEEILGVTDKFITKTHEGPVPSSEQADCVVSYYVMEHITDLKGWLTELLNMLKVGGLIVLEVPDFSRYPRESLLFEHFQHFTKESIESVFRLLGIDVVEISHELISRYFGIVAVGKYTGSAQSINPSDESIDRNYEIYQKYLIEEKQIMNNCEALATQVQGSMKNSDPDTPIYFWGANDLATILVEAFNETFQDTRIEIIDSSDEKIGHRLDGFKNLIVKPFQKTSNSLSPTFIICSKNYFHEIKHMIIENGFDDNLIFDGTQPFYKENEAKNA